MVQSLSAAERGNPPPRRKSCLACIKAKRRCDLSSPVCARCRQRKYDCTYPPGSGSKRRSPAVALPSTPSPPNPSATIGYPLATGCSSYPEAAIDPAALVLNSSIDMLDTLLDIPEIGAEDPLAEQFLLPLNFDPTGMLEVSPPLKASVALFPPPLDGVDAKALFSWAVRTRLQYAIDKIASAPRQMVEEIQTPWCHRHLYGEEMPRSVQG